MGLRPGIRSTSCLTGTYIGSEYDNVKKVSDNIEDVKSVASAIGEDFPGDGLDTIAENIEGIKTVSEITDEVVVVSDIKDEVVSVASINEEVVPVASNIDEVVTVAGIKDEVVTVAGIEQEIRDVPSYTTQAIDAASAAEEDAIIATNEADRSEQGADRAEVAADAAFVNADVYPDIAAGRAAVADGEQFQVVEGRKIVRYRRDSSSAQTAVSEMLTAEGVHRIVRPLLHKNMMEDSGFQTEVVPPVRSGSASLVPISNPYLKSIGVDKGLITGETSAYTTVDVNPEWQGKYVIMACFIHMVDGSSASISLPSVSGFLLEDSVILNRDDLEFSVVQESTDTVLVYSYGYIDPAKGLGSIAIGAAGSAHAVVAPTFAISDTPIFPEDFDHELLYLEQGDLLARLSDVVSAISEIPDPIEVISEEIKHTRVTNRFRDSGFKSGVPVVRNGATTLVPIEDAYLNSIGVVAGVSVDSSSHYATSEIKPEWVGKYCIMSFFAHFTEGSSIYVGASSGFLLDGTLTFNREGLETTVIEIDSKTTLVLTYGKIPEGVDRFAIGTSFGDFGPDRLLVGPAFGVSDVPLSPTTFAYDVLYPLPAAEAAPVDPEEVFLAKALAPPPGTTGYVEGDHDGHLIRRDFLCTNEPLSSSAFNFRADYVDGVLVRQVSDDVPPYRAQGASLGGNHSYYLREAVAEAHGKSMADWGSIYEKDGVEYLLIRTLNRNTVLMTGRDDEFSTVLPLGIYTHVSGGVNTDPIELTELRAKTPQWHAGLQGHTTTYVVDGKEVQPSLDELGFKDHFKVYEYYEFVSKSDLVAWWEEYGSTGAERAEGLQPVFSVSICYRFDTEGQCTIYSDWRAHVDTSIAGTRKNFMFLQAMLSTMTDYYIPKALPFTHGGFPVDYAMIEPAQLTIENNLSNVEFYPERCEPDGIFADRGIALKGQDYGFAMGFLPVADAGIDVRRDNASVYAMQIRGDTGKLYMSAIHYADDIVPAGTSFGIVGYRNVFPLNDHRTDSYVVRTDSDVYWYMDWHDTKKIDTLTTPRDLIGRNLEIVESSDSVRLLSSFLGKSITVQVDAANSYGYLILKVTG